MKFNYKSESFNTMTQCKKEIALLKSELCKAFGVTREQIKIPNGLITLYGYSKDIDNYIPLTSTIYNFNDKLKSDLWEHYHLICNVETK